MNAKTPNDALRYADLLEPISADEPCGPDLEYDSAFVMLQTAAAPKSEAQYGDFVDVPQAANWAEIERDCRALLLRTKDIRLAVILLRCRIRQSGATGLRDGLAFLKAMLERYGEALYPLPVFEGERDPVMYSNAIAALADPDGALADVRDIAMPKTSGVQLQLRDIEKSFALPRQKDALAPESVSRLLKDLWGRRDAVTAALVEAQRLLQEIVASCQQTLDADAPELGMLAKLLQPFAQAQLEGGASAAPAAATVNPAAEPVSNATAPASAATTPNAAPASAPAQSNEGYAFPAQPIASEPERMDRWNALSRIQETRMWFEQNEPSSPVIVLLRQSERMVGKRFSEIAHIIPADLLAKWDEVDV
ncbi:type VI secretion system ImpA family N-terminal domain-containing protein [Trinickia sp. YCB016]